MRSRPYRLRGKPRGKHIDANLAQSTTRNPDGDQLARPNASATHIADGVSKSGSFGRSEDHKDTSPIGGGP